MKEEDKRTEEMKHYVGIIIEAFDAKIATVIEAVQISNAAMHRRMDGMEYAVNEMRKDVNKTFMIISGKIDKNKDSIEDHEERITELEKAIV